MKTAVTVLFALVVWIGCGDDGTVTLPANESVDDASEPEADDSSSSTDNEPDTEPPGDDGDENDAGDEDSEDGSGSGDGDPQDGDGSDDEEPGGEISVACLEPGQSGRCLVEDFPDRPFDVWVPDYDEDAQLAVVLAFHGGSGNSEAAARGTCPDGLLSDPECLHVVGLAEGFVTVYPNGTLSSPNSNSRIWNAGGGENGFSCVGFCDETIDEAGYISAILDDLARWLPIDPARVYAAGLSNGGAMAHRMGCELADRIAAIAPIGAGNQFATSAECTPSEPVAVLHVHGTQDLCWLYEGGPIDCFSRSDRPLPPSQGQGAVSVEASMDGWAERNGCDAEPVTEDGPERVEDSIRVER
ncbi:MAG: PHB depolymerase family esterase, partial [Myxococcota bacterium]